MVPVTAGSEKGKAMLDELIAGLGGVAPDTKARRFPRRYPDEAANAPPMTYLDTDSLFPTGPRIMVVYAEQGNLKTQFVLSKCLEITQRSVSPQGSGSTEGRPSGGKILYIAAEDGNGVDTQRLPAYVETLRLDWAALRENWWPISEPISLTRDVETLIAETAEQGFKPDVVVVDVLTACTEALKINDPTDGNLIMNAAQRLANGFGGALVVLLTHPGKDQARGPVGTYAQTARADAVLELKWRGDQLAVFVEKMKSSGLMGKTLAFAVEKARDGTPLVRGRAQFDRKRSPTDDDAMLIHLGAAGASSFASGIDDADLAQRIIGDRRSDEDGADHSTRIAKMRESLKKRHKETAIRRTRHARGRGAAILALAHRREDRRNQKLTGEPGNFTCVFRGVFSPDP